MGAGPPTDDAGPPDVTDPPDRATLMQSLQGWSGPWRVSFAQGGGTTTVTADQINLSRGGDLAELHFDDRYVTVSVHDQLHTVTHDDV